MSGRRITGRLRNKVCAKRILDRAEKGGTSLALRTRGGCVSMKRHQYLSANIVTMTLAFLLWQAQVKAETKSDLREKSESKSGVEGEGEAAQSVTKSQQRRLRARSAMRQRALLYERAIAVAAAKYRVDPRALWT